MALIWIATLCVIAGVLLTAVPPMLKGRLSRTPSASDGRGDTLEPRRPGRGLGLKANWPGLGLIGVGIVLFLAAAVV
jgi:hypothetical protein